MATTAYPLPKFRFMVDFGGSRHGFQEVTGLDFTYDVIEYREGNSNAFHKVKMPGLQKFSNVTLKYGMVPGDSEFYDWLTATQGVTPDRRTLKVSLLDDAGAPKYTWQVLNAWVVALKFTDMKSDGNEVAVQTVEIAHESIVQNTL